MPPMALGEEQSVLESIDILLTGGTVVTMDADGRVIHDGAVAIRGRDIVAVGTADELRDS
jgi:5-methylthioadenosine/S-adenosylhomocysteine deaminase